jgi:hypothetical protein
MMKDTILRLLKRKDYPIPFLGCLTALRISSGRTRELARADGRLLQPLDGRREAPDIKWMVICSADGTARSVRAICAVERRGVRNQE